jgi:predicted dehydrogenase
MVAAAERTKRVLMVGYNRRFQGLWRTVKEVLDTNGIGQIRQVNLQFAFYRRTYWEGKIQPEVHSMLRQVTGWPDEYLHELEQGQDWHASASESGGGMFSNSGSHLVDLVLWLAGSRPVEVVTFAESAGMPAECFLNIQARLANGVLVSITSGDVESGGFAGQGSLTFVGEEGIVSYDFRKPQEVWLDRDDKRDQIISKFADSNAAASFVATVLDGDINLAPPREGAYASAFSEAIYKSAAEKRIVTVHDGGGQV